MLYQDIPETRNISNVLGDNREDDIFTQLHMAVIENRISEVQNLVQNKTLINTQTKNGVTSLLLACVLSVDTTIPKILINSGADVNLSDFVNFSPLMAACKSKTQKIETVELLLKSGANINYQDNCKDTALHYAIVNNHLQLVDLLLQSGADTSLSDRFGRNPLIIALKKCHEDIAEKILPFTEDLNVVDCDGSSALIFAASKRSKNIIVRLVQRGANVNINVDGVMPVTLTLENQDPAIFEYIWDLTDIEVLKKEGGLQSFINDMLYSDWITPRKIQYFYKVLDTPGVELNDSGYLRILAYYMSTLESDKFLTIDLCGIVTKLMEKNAKLIDLDIEGFISVCYRYEFDYKHKLFQILMNNNADLNNFRFIYMSMRNDPEFTVFLLPYCICINPIDILKFIDDVDRLDIPMLKLIKSILRLCTPYFKLREDCIKYLKSCEIGLDYCRYIILDEFLEFSNNCTCSKYVKYDLNAEEKVILLELYNEVLEFLSVDRLPTLQELSRDIIRKCLAANCVSTSEYLSKLNILHLPQCITDIIRCNKSVVNS